MTDDIQMMPKYACPSCKRGLDAHVGKTKPRAHDLTVCAYCMAVLEFLDDGFRLMTEADIQKLQPADRAEIERAIKFVKKALGK